ncbi:DUF6115 domain-containing protein [Campylobacter mucosalis]|uniref:Periplasmic protein n=1 Tax=Campylobacter mucosalis CCUG 21559 TaxID=1032067 RepID=A0A6G5QE79_9BACT|nr:hypothetical protein [Campylobacter mucosalis]KEA45767.1 hypothetical protein CR66_04960 [Campylobacter mucosalis]QCD43934.1 hypothetical protein CMUC_0114 [Campylobacter mucosalis CCUG 21559]QKF62284.1 hypothetical protein CMCT_0115 [Campylobacter mucosalis]
MQDILLIGVIVVLAIFFIFLIIKEKESNRRFDRYEKALEALMQKNFTLQKQLDMLENLDIKSTDDININSLEERINQSVQTQIDSKISPIFLALKNIESVIDDFTNEQQNRMFNLEERTREINKITPNSQNEDEQIVRLFSEGKSIENIAKDLRLGVGRVELVLKLHKLV